MLRNITLAALVAVFLVGANVSAEAQWWRALSTLLKGVEEAVPGLRAAPKAAPEEFGRALPKTDAPIPDAMSEARRSPAAASLSAARASALSWSHCVSSGDMKSQDCNRRLQKHQTVLDEDGLGFSESGILEDGVPFSINARLTDGSLYIASVFGTPPNAFRSFCSGPVTKSKNAVTLAMKCGDPK